MTPQRAACLLLALIACLYTAPLSACGSHVAGYTPLEQRYRRGLLFRVQRCGEPVSYVFGTMHLDLPVTASPSIQQTFGTVLPQVSEAVIEVAASEQETQLGLPRHLQLKAGSPGLESLIGKKYFARLVPLLPKTMSLDKVNRLQPWFAAILVALGDQHIDFSQTLDKQIERNAALQGKRVVGLETMDEQLGIFSDLPLAFQSDILRSEIDDHAREAGRIQLLKKAYLSENINQLLDLSKAEETYGRLNPAQIRQLDERILNERNHRMESRMVPILKSKSVLVAIGSMHLPGPDGVLHLLEKDGYEVTPVMPQ
jgi:uncharacterized protein YbaP (TraB family)